MQLVLIGLTAIDAPSAPAAVIRPYRNNAAFSSAANPPLIRISRANMAGLQRLCARASIFAVASWAGFACGTVAAARGKAGTAASLNVKNLRFMS